MQSRKGWRNRGPEAGEALLALLQALRENMGASAVALVDDDRSHAEREDIPPSFWNAFDDQACAAFDWDAWYGQLRTAERAHGVCSCGAEHRLSGFLVHGRWAFLLAGATLPSQGAGAIASTLKALAAHLPPSKEREQELRGTTGRGGSERDAPPREAEPVVWWVRKDPQ